MGKILVIGSSNTDLIVKVERFPAAGETVHGKSFMQAMGGKGANQAVAAQRLGGEVTFVTCVGNDANGKNALNYYRAEGLDITHARVVDSAPTGTAVILVNGSGENCIVVTPGANDKLIAGYVKEIEDLIKAASMIVLQMEIPFETVREVCKLASKSGVPIVLNVAPARKVDATLLKLVDIVVVNENEIEVISGEPLRTGHEEMLIDNVLAMGAHTVILTLGDQGSLIKSRDLTLAVPAFRVNALDTTAAGDTFCGALVAQLVRGLALAEAVKFATAASAICVTRMGAQPSIPTEEEVRTFLLSR